MLAMAIPVVKFSREGYKIKKILLKNQHTQRKLLNFENWCSDEVSKIGHHFSNEVIFKNSCYQKMSITNDVLLNWYYSMKKIEKDSDDF